MCTKQRMSMRKKLSRGVVGVILYSVHHNADNGAYNCECGLQTHMGIPCCHSISVSTPNILHIVFIGTNVFNCTKTDYINTIRS